MRLALVLFLFITGCASLATYNVLVRPLPEGIQPKQDPTVDDRIQLAIFGELARASRSSGSSRTLYQWTDASGSVRVTEDPSEIPAGVSTKVVR